MRLLMLRKLVIGKCCCEHVGYIKSSFFTGVFYITFRLYLNPTPPKKRPRLRSGSRRRTPLPHRVLPQTRKARRNLLEYHRRAIMPRWVSGFV